MAAWGAQRAAGMGFGLRLFASVVIAMAMVGAVGYVVMAHQLRATQIDDYAKAQRADVRSFEAVGRRAGGMAPAVKTIDHLLDAIAQRPGTLRTLLVDRRSVVVAAGNDPGLVGHRDSDTQIARALRDDTSYSGRETDRRRDRRDFEFVAPVALPGGRYVLEVGYDHRVLDANLRDVRRTLEWIGLLGLLGGLGVFYLAGGRVLMRSHRLALQRATRDGLTDLPNHRAFQDELPRAVASAARYQQPLALIVLDVDDFKFLNDRHGHPHGDAVLRRVAEVLSAGRTEDRAYRVGGDEFAMLMAHTDGEGARAIARRLMRAFGAAELVVSLGISDLRPGEPAEDLRAEADAGLYEAKRRGGGRFIHFDEIRDHVVITTSTRTDLVRSLIDQARLSMVFQPIWDLGSQRLLGIEALMRPDPETGLAGPAEAFDLAEQISRVHELDVLCIRSALREAPALGDGVLLFLNLSPQTLDLDATGHGWLLDAVTDAGLAAKQVVVEITERFGGRTDAVVLCLQRLREDGFQLALDDVGTGNSGLEMLQKVHAEFVKIDRSIVLTAATDPNARAVLMAMATYARQTGSYVIAEGIEDRDTLDFLDDMNGHHIQLERIVQGGQGFGLARPTPDGAGDRPPGLLEKKPGSPSPAARVP